MSLYKQILTHTTGIKQLHHKMSTLKSNAFTEVYSEPSQTSKMEFFAKLGESFQSLTTFAKSSILDICLGSEYASA